MPLDDCLVASIQNVGGQVLTYQPNMQLRFKVPPDARARIVELIEAVGFTAITGANGITEVDLLRRQNRTIST
jgi:hypothetical protein